MTPWSQVRCSAKRGWALRAMPFVPRQSDGHRCGPTAAKRSGPGPGRRHLACLRRGWPGGAGAMPVAPRREGLGRRAPCARYRRDWGPMRRHTGCRLACPPGGAGVNALRVAGRHVPASASRLGQGGACRRAAKDCIFIQVSKRVPAPSRQLEPLTMQATQRRIPPRAGVQCPVSRGRLA